MADSDKTLKLLIELGVIGKEDAQAAADLLKETGNKADVSSDKFAGLGKNARALHSALHLIGHESGPAVGAAVSAAAALMTGGIFTAVFAVRELFNWFGALQKKAEDFRERQAAAWLSAEQGAYDASTAADDYNQKLATAMTKADGLKTTFDSQKKALEEQLAEHKKLLEAMENEQLAAPGANKEAIHKKFAGLRDELDASGDEQRLALAKKQRLDATLTRDQSYLTGGGLGDEKDRLTFQKAQIDAAIKEITAKYGEPEKIQAAADATASKLEEKIQMWQETIKNQLGVTWSREQVLEMFQKKGYFKNLMAPQAHLEEYQTALGTQHGIEAALKKNEEASGKEEQAIQAATTEISSLNETIRELQNKLNLQHAGAEITTAAGIADRLLGGGKATSDEAQYLMRVANVATGHANNLAQAANVLHTIEGNTGKTQALLERIVHVVELGDSHFDNLFTRVSALEARVEHSRNTTGG